MGRETPSTPYLPTHTRRGDPNPPPRQVRRTPRAPPGRIARHPRTAPDLDAALLDFNEAIRRDPKYAQAYTNRGNCYRKLHTYGEAESDYTQAIQLDRSNPKAFNNRGALQPPGYRYAIWPNRCLTPTNDMRYRYHIYISPVGV